MSAEKSERKPKLETYRELGHACPVCDSRCLCSDGGMDITACQHCAEEAPDEP